MTPGRDLMPWQIHAWLHVWTDAEWRKAQEKRYGADTVRMLRGVADMIEADRTQTPARDRREGRT
jgi:hypothetical protein